MKAHAISGLVVAAVTAQAGARFEAQPTPTPSVPTGAVANRAPLQRARSRSSRWAR